MSQPITDIQLYDFLQLLAADQRKEDGLLLGEWETNFLTSWLRSERQRLWLTPGRRSAVDRMWRKYGADLKHIHPSDLVEHTAPVAPAAADTCEVWIRDETRRQVRCGAPAAWVNQKGYRYCPTCLNKVNEDLRRLKQRPQVVKPFIKPQPAAPANSPHGTSALTA